MVATYRKKLVVTIKALQYTGDNVEGLSQWVGKAPDGTNGFDVYRSGPRLWVQANKSWLSIEEGEWVAKDRHGFYPIKDDPENPGSAPENYELVE